MSASDAGWLSSVLGLAQTRDEALADATEGKALAEKSALDGLLEGVVDGVLGWVTGSSDARTAYSITAIGLSTARDVAVRSAFAAFDLASIERGATTERQAVTANKDRIISEAQSYRDQVASSTQRTSTPPAGPAFVFPGFEQIQAENRARDRSNTLTEWGVTALRTWIASVNASGVLNASTTTTTTAASGATGPATTGNGLGGTTNGTGSNSPGDWQQALQQAQAALNAFASNTDPSGLTGATGNAAPGTPPPANDPNPENPPAGAPPAGGNPPGNADQVRADVEQTMRDMIGRVESGGAGVGATQREVINCVTGETATLDAGLSASAIRWKTKTGPAPTLTEEQARNLAFGTNLAADAIPLVGTAKGAVELLTNHTLGGFGPEMSRTEWWLTLGATSLSFLPWGKVIGKATGNAAIGLANRAKSAYDALPALFQKAAKSTDDAAKAADEAIDRAIDASKASPDAVAVQNVSKELPNTGKLVFDPASRSWTSPGGLVYGQGSAHGNRVNHVLDHLIPNPAKPTHSIFNVDRTGLIGLIDEAFASRGAGVLQGNNRVFDIDMGRVVGTNGESRIRIVLREGTNNVITAYPIQ